MISTFDNVLRNKLLFMCLIVTMAGLGFYYVQNSGQLAGGGIALSKLIWLAYAVLFWYCIPILIISDKHTPHVWKTIYGIFLANMLLRAVIELYMMYVSNNWSAYYGIAHNALTIILLSMLLQKYRLGLHRDIFFGYAVILLFMFAVEIAFVIYMLKNVTGAGVAVFFVPEGKGHTVVLAITWLVDILLTGYLYLFGRRWVRGEFVRAGV